MSSTGRVVHIEGDTAVVDVGGVRRRVSLAMLVLEGAAVEAGDWVLIHTGFVVTRLDPGEAEELVRLRREMAIPDPQEGP